MPLTLMEVQSAAAEEKKKSATTKQVICIKLATTPGQFVCMTLTLIILIRLAQLVFVEMTDALREMQAATAMVNVRTMTRLCVSWLKCKQQPQWLT